MVQKIEFIPNSARKPQGLGLPGIELFRVNPYVSCAREAGQNTNDAPDDGKRPVRMTFNVLSVPSSEVPFADELLQRAKTCLEQSIARCKKTGQDKEKDRTVQFFKRAVAALSEDQIRVLEIADFNTTGLVGPFEDDDSIFNSLIKGDGVTNKPQVDAGGSYGIGKNAAFTVSDVQTVLYSTLARNIEDPAAPDVFGCQARVQLISHDFGEEHVLGEGYWGHDNFRPVVSPDELPAWMVRSERGTSLFAICFREQESWAERMALSVLTNFALAVLRGDMEFSIDAGKYQINKSTLASLLDDKKLAEVAETAILGAALERTRELHRCLTSGATVTHTIPVKGYGEASLHILVDEGLPRSVHIIRNGMYISSNLRKFGFPLVSFQGTREFVAVLEPHQGKSGRPFSELLKRLENPEHDNFEPERLRDDHERAKVIAAVKKLHKDLRDAIKDEAKVPESDEANLDELAHLFAADPDGDGGKEGQEKDPERFTYGKSKKKPKKRSDLGTATGTTGGAGGSGGSSGGTGGGTGSGAGSGTGGKGSRGPAKPFPVASPRSRREPSGSPYSHRIFFTPKKSGRAILRIDAAGLTRTAPLELVNAESGTIVERTIEIDLEDGKRQSIGLHFSDNYDGPIELRSFSEDAGDEQ